MTPTTPTGRPFITTTMWVIVFALIASLFLCIFFGFVFLSLTHHPCIFLSYGFLYLTHQAQSPSVVILTEVLASNKTIVVPQAINISYYNSTYEATIYQHTQGWYNFSFNASYNGYIIFNETNTGMSNNGTNGYLVLYMSTERPYYFTDASGKPLITLSAYVAPYLYLVPQENKTYRIPILSGENYFIFENANVNQSINVTYNLKYIGLEASG